MKKALSVILFAAMILSLCAFNVGAAWDGVTASASLAGEGTQDSPYVVETAEDLAFLAKSVNEGNTYEGKYIVQTADIDLGGKEWTPIGFQKVNGAEVDAPFSGVYSGLGHKVTGLSITKTPTNHTGLFGYVMSGEVEAGIANLTVEGAITLDGVASSNIGIGGVAGAIAKDTGTFKAPLAVINCTSNVTVTVTGVTGEPRVGGFAGYAFNATVANCVNNGEVKFEGNNQTRAAGLIGQTNRTHFIGCVNNGKLSAKGELGGIVGKCYGKVTECSNKGEVIGTQDIIGGIVGHLHDATHLDLINTTNSQDGTVTGPGANDVVGKIN